MESHSSGLVAIEAATDDGHGVSARRKLGAPLRRREPVGHAPRSRGTLLSEQFGGAAEWTTLIHADHNHVQQETHGGREFLVHRKGAQSAAENEAGVVPGSMGTPSFHTMGRGCAASLTSCSHGAGRRMSRTEARRSVSAKAFRRQVGKLWYDQRRSDRLRDESPGAYKDIREVMRAQKELTKTVRELTPVLSYKGV